MNDLWWLDFVDDGKLMGSSVVYARDLIEAAREADWLGINPGGAVIAMDKDDIPEDMINRFTPVAELVARGIVTPEARH
jgi:hypothetical protein